MAITPEIRIIHSDMSNEVRTEKIEVREATSDMSPDGREGVQLREILPIQINVGR